MNEKLQHCLQRLLRGQDSDSVNFFFEILCEEGQAVRVDLERGTANIFDEGGDEVGFVQFAIGIQERQPAAEPDPLATAIRDQLVDTMREELHNCPDPLAYVSDPELEQIDVFWDKTVPDGLVLDTDKGKFRVSVAVTPIE